MSIDPTYVKSAIETLELIQQLYNYLKANQKIAELSDYLSQVEGKAKARIGSSLGQALGVDIPVADQEGKPTEYWKGVRDMASYAIKNWNQLKDEQRFVGLLKNTSNSLYARITPEEKAVSPLEEILQSEPSAVSVPEPVSPLEEILTTTTPTPKPSPTPTPPVTPTPTPKPSPTPTPPVTPTPTPKPSLTPTPPVTPIPTPIPEPEPEPIPKPQIPDIPEQPPISPVTPDDIPTPPDKLQALDEALQASGLRQPSMEAIEPASSLADMILAKDETGEKEEEDDMLSLSLREALKILRDEDED